MKKIFLIIFLSLAALLLSACQEEPLLRSQGGLSLKKVASFEEPVFATRAPRLPGLFVAEKGGKIIRLADGKKSTWLDIEDRVRNSGEGGLLSMAFDPLGEKLFYLYYTDQQGDQVVAEGVFFDKPRLRREVLRMDDFASNHNGGQIGFGPGGLYIATGDGGGSGDPERTSLNPFSLLGKMLRIEPRRGRPYSIPIDNPFRNGVDGKPEIFSLGLRNPWRWDIADGRIWIGDVGQERQEEISAPRLERARGGSFGWSRWEGRLSFNEDQVSTNTIWPVLTYERGCSVTGGVVGGGRLAGRYLYGDFCEGKIRSFRLEDGRARDDRFEGLRVPNLVSFTRSRGQIFVISLSGNIYRLDG